MSRASRLFSFLVVPLALVCGFQSCVSVDSTLGSDMLPSTWVIPVDVVEVGVKMGQRYPDSLQVAMDGTAIVGSVNTDKYGTVSVGTAMDICPAYDSIRWGGSPEFRMMRLAIPLSSCQVRDDSQKYIPQNIYLHKLKISLDSTKIYSNSITENDYEPSLCVKSPALFSAGDSVVFLLTEEFAKPLFDLDSTAMDSTSLFLEKFKGIYMDCDVAEANGGRLNAFDLNNARLSLTFNSENARGYRRDTTVLFYVGAYSSVLKIDQDRLIPEMEECGATAIYDGLAGIKPKIEAKPLRKYFADLAKAHGVEARAVMVSKAQFEFPFEYPGSSEALSGYPSNMYLARRMRDSSGTVFYSPISEIYASIYDVGSMNRSRMSYCPDAALYIQSLLNAPEEEIDDTYDLWLIPNVSYTTTTTSSNAYNPYSYYSYYYYGFDPYSTTTTNTYYVIDNMNYQSCVLNGPAAEKHPTLRVTYTILK